MVENFISRKVRRDLFRMGLLICLAGALLPSRSLSAEFSARSIANLNGISIMEVEGDYSASHSDEGANSYPREIIAKEFYRTHPDQYDFLVFISNFDFQMPLEAVAFYGGVKNDVTGIGLEQFDNSSLYGSRSILQGTIDMGNLAALASDPLTPGFSFTMGTLSHELMHRWGAHARFRTAEGSMSAELLGHLDSHWSFLLDSKCSLEYGNNWHDNGNGTFTSFPGRKYFSPLDLYLMGMIDKSAVPPMLLIANPDVDPKQVTQSGVTIGGKAGFVNIEQIVAAEGERLPNHRASQKLFRIGCVYLTRPGTYNPDALSSIRTILTNWPVWFSSLTNGLAQVSVDAALQPKPVTNPGPAMGTVDPRTTPAEINDGIAWLLSHQQADGSWQDNPSTIGRDTAEALRILTNFPELFPDPASGADYLERSAGGNNDFLSRKIMALAALGHATTDHIEELLANQNQVGGWGGQIGQASNSLDTALVLRGLAESGHAASSAVSEATAYLDARQNPDGGWGSEGEDSDILTTSNVVIVYSILFNQGFNLTTQLEHACIWLQNRQNMDGGFGDGASTGYHTALAVSALQRAGIKGTGLDKALKYLGDTQALDGSWNGSAYETALAVNARWTAEKEPDLQVSSAEIRITPETVAVLPTQIEIVAEISNQGLPNLPEVKVALYDREMTPENLLGEQVLAVNGKSMSQAHFAVTVLNGNAHRYLVVADPENLIAESSEVNNRAMKWLYPETTCDLVAKPGDILATPTNVEYLQPVDIAVTISNQGTLDAFNIPLKFYLDDGISPYAITTRYADIPAGEATNLEFTWLADHPGINQRLTVVADPLNALLELDETNNMAATQLTVQQTTKANLKITHQEITITPSPALEATDSAISATVTNNGFGAVQDLVVEFRAAKPDNSEESLLGFATLPVLAAGATATVTHLWKSVPITGDRIISVLVDPDNAVEEITDNDNQAFVELNILTLPDLAISASSMSLTPAYPKAGEALTVQVAVQNNGGQAVKDVTVTLAQDGGTPKIALIPAIAGNAEVLASFSLAAAEVVDGVHRLQVVLDPDELIRERAENNNHAEQEFGAQNSDMWLTERYLSPNGDGAKDLTKFFFRLKKKQTVQVAISDGDGLMVRKYADSAFRETLSGNIVWDGLSDKGTVVPDGEYRIGVIDAGGIPLGSLVVTVDTNRSSFLEAVGTEYLLQNNISCMLPDFEQGQWFKDESGLIALVRWPNSITPGYPTGLYKISPDGEDITRLIPSQWVSGVGAEFDYSVTGYAVSPDDETIAFVLEIQQAVSPYSFISSQLWSVDRYGENLQKLAENIYAVTGQEIHLTAPSWVPGGEDIAVNTYSYTNGYAPELWIVDSLGRDPLQTLPTSTSWSPDGKWLAYTVSNYNNSGSDGYLLVDRTGVNPERFFATPSTYLIISGGWSPDSSRFAYWVSPGEYYNLKVVSTGGETIFESQAELYSVSSSWLNNEKIIATENSDWNISTIWMFDTKGILPEQTLSESSF